MASSASAVSGTSTASASALISTSNVGKGPLAAGSGAKPSPKIFHCPVSEKLAPPPNAVARFRLERREQRAATIAANAALYEVHPSRLSADGSGIQCWDFASLQVRQDVGSMANFDEFNTFMKFAMKKKKAKLWAHWRSSLEELDMIYFDCRSRAAGTSDHYFRLHNEAGVCVAFVAVCVRTLPALKHGTGSEFERYFYLEALPGNEDKLAFEADRAALRERRRVRLAAEASASATRDEQLAREAAMVRTVAARRAEKERRQRELLVRAKAAQKTIKAQLDARGTNSLSGLARLFKIVDTDNSWTLSKRELANGLRNQGVNVSDDDVDALVLYYDHDGNGDVSYDELIEGLRGELNDVRRAAVHRAFAKLDADGSGVVTVDDLRGVYDASLHQDVIGGKMTEDDVLQQMVDGFEVASVDKDGSVTRVEFEQYYGRVSASVDDDVYFVAMIERAWLL